LSDDCKELLICMMEPDPTLRIELPDIVVHPWMKQEMATQDEIIQVMTARAEARR